MVIHHNIIKLIISKPHITHRPYLRNSLSILRECEKLENTFPANKKASSLISEVVPNIRTAFILT